MIKTTGVEMDFGDVRFVSEVEEVPASTEVHENVTIKNTGTPGRDAYFDVNFFLRLKHELDGTEFSNSFVFEVRTPASDRQARYVDIEAEAARALAPMLRDAAAKIEEKVAEYDERNSSDTLK